MTNSCLMGVALAVSPYPFPPSPVWTLLLLAEMWPGLIQAALPVPRQGWFLLRFMGPLRSSQPVDVSLPGTEAADISGPHGRVYDEVEESSMAPFPGGRSLCVLDVKRREPPTGQTKGDMEQYLYKELMRDKHKVSARGREARGAGRGGGNPGGLMPSVGPGGLVVGSVCAGVGRWVRREGYERRVSEPWSASVWRGPGMVRRLVFEGSSSRGRIARVVLFFSTGMRSD